MTTQTKKAKRESILLPPEFMAKVRAKKELEEKKNGFKVTLQSYVMGVMEKGMGK